MSDYLALARERANASFLMYQAEMNNKRQKTVPPQNASVGTVEDGGGLGSSFWSTQAGLPRTAPSSDPLAVPALGATPGPMGGFSAAFAAAELSRFGKSNPHLEHLMREHCKAWGEDIEEARKRVLGAAALAASYGLRAATKATYESGVVSYELYCHLFGLDGYDINMNLKDKEELLLGFCGWSSSRLSAGSMDTYLSGIRSRHIELRVKWYDRADMPLLKRCLAGFAWMDKCEKNGRLRLAMTFDITRDVLKKAFDRVDLTQAHPQDIYDWRNPVLAAAVFSLGFCGIFRPSEFSVRKTSKGPVSEPLLCEHFTTQSPDAHPERITGANVTIAHTKVDQSGVRSDRALGPTGDTFVCAVKWVPELLNQRKAAGEIITGKSYLFALKSTPAGPLRALTYDDLTLMLQYHLGAAGYDTSKYKGHSFRIGAATTLALNGVPTSIIEDMGCWQRGSLSLPKYLRGMAAAPIRQKFAVYFTRPINLSEDNVEQQNTVLKAVMGHET